jgi:hypothetical protein
MQHHLLPSSPFLCDTAHIPRIVCVVIRRRPAAITWPQLRSWGLLIPLQALPCPRVLLRTSTTSDPPTRITLVHLLLLPTCPHHTPTTFAQAPPLTCTTPASLGTLFTSRLFGTCLPCCHLVRWDRVPTPLKSITRRLQTHHIGFLRQIGPWRGATGSARQHIAKWWRQLCGRVPSYGVGLGSKGGGRMNR